MRLQKRQINEKHVQYSLTIPKRCVDALGWKQGERLLLNWNLETRVLRIKNMNSISKNPEEERKEDTNAFYY